MGLNSYGMGLNSYFLVEYVQIKVKTIIKRLNDVKRQTNYLVCNIEGTGSIDTFLKSYKFFDEGSVGTKADSCPLSTRESL